MPGPIVKIIWTHKKKKALIDTEFNRGYSNMIANAVIAAQADNTVRICRTLQASIPLILKSLDPESSLIWTTQKRPGGSITVRIPVRCDGKEVDFPGELLDISNQMVIGLSALILKSILRPGFAGCSTTKSGPNYKLTISTTFATTIGSRTYAISVLPQTKNTGRSPTPVGVAVFTRKRIPALGALKSGDHITYTLAATTNGGTQFALVNLPRTNTTYTKRPIRDKSARPYRGRSIKKHDTEDLDHEKGPDAVTDQAQRDKRKGSLVPWYQQGKGR